ncbi:multicopper oxidase family protein [Poriferisphaera sp. WC338]|uniref:multicopper oxidase family protein n=1 Tax=Poriferisphaera sp. WC338 TaxID=3425129 RepID=UPI003D819C7C
MPHPISRRRFFASAAAAITGGGVAARAVGQAKPSRNDLIHDQDIVDITNQELDNLYSVGNRELPSALPVDPERNHFPRIEKGKIYSPPPPLMGKQMGRVISPGIPPLGYEMDGDVKVFKLIAQPIEIEITDGFTEHTYSLLNSTGPYRPFSYRPTVKKTMLAWGFNGSCPGPTLEATEGDTVRIVVKNELPQPTSIHWHGFELPFSQDGASGYFPWNAHRPILPGQTREYQFTLHQSGTLMYHTGFNMMVQEGMGLAGNFVVHPRKPEHKIDRDFAIMLQQWFFIPGNEAPNVVQMEAKIATFNGLTLPKLPMLQVNQYDRVRIRFGNLSLKMHPIHLHGYSFEVVGTTGGPLQPSARYKEATVAIHPGQTRDIEFVAWNPGTWRMHCHVLHHTMNMMPNAPMGIMPPEGMFTWVNVKPRDPQYDPRSNTAPWKFEGNKYNNL